MKNLLITILIFTISISCSDTYKGKHLFILAGQSNMAGLDPDESFVPAIAEEFGLGNIIIVKDAIGGQPIRRWDKNWKPDLEAGEQNPPFMYDSLMNKLNSAIKNEKIATVSLIWMQGERDANEGLAAEYEMGLKSLYNQLCSDLNRDDIYFIIGRISDFDMANERYPHWTRIREIQLKVSESSPLFGWINTDDLNDGFNRRGDSIHNDLHMSVEGYRILGERFAEKSIQLIRGGQKKE